MLRCLNRHIIHRCSSPSTAEDGSPRRLRISTLAIRQCLGRSVLTINSHSVESWVIVCRTRIAWSKGSDNRRIRLWKVSIYRQCQMIHIREPQSTSKVPPQHPMATDRRDSLSLNRFSPHRPGHSVLMTPKKQPLNIAHLTWPKNVTRSKIYLTR